MSGNTERNTEDLTQVLQVINAKGDTGELEEIMEESFEDQTKSNEIKTRLS